MRGPRSGQGEMDDGWVGDMKMGIDQTERGEWHDSRAGWERAAHPGLCSKGGPHTHSVVESRGADKRDSEKFGSRGGTFGALQKTSPG